jgi:hypothetical protein
MTFEWTALRGFDACSAPEYDSAINVDNDITRLEVFSLAGLEF